MTEPRYKPGDRLITMQDLARDSRAKASQPPTKLPYSRIHIYRLIARGKFPKPIHLTGPHGRVAWIEREVDEWLAERAADQAA